MTGLHKKSVEQINRQISETKVFVTVLVSFGDNHLFPLYYK